MLFNSDLRGPVIFKFVIANTIQPKNFAGNAGLNYTSNFYRINDWYTAWLPDRAHLDQLHDTKTVYDVRVRYV